MKKLISLLLALTLVLSLSAAPAEEESEWVDFADRYPEAKAFDSFWVSGDGQVRINAFCRLDGFEMIIEWMTGDDTFTYWEYLMTYDQENHKLVCDGIGLMAENKIKDGEVTESKTIYQDGTASFWLNDQGELCWDDEKEDTFSATTFHKIGNFPDTYTCDRATLELKYAGEDLIYDVNLDWADSAFQSWHWALGGNYDPETDTLPVEGYKLLYTYKEDGELDLDADQHETEVKATFTLNENRNVVISSDDETINGLVFERNWINMWQWVY